MEPRRFYISAYGEEYTSMTFGEEDPEVMQASRSYEDNNVFRPDMLNQNPYQSSYEYSYQDPNQDPNTQEAFVNFQTAEMEDVTSSIEGPNANSFSAWGGQVDPFQPGATSHEASLDYNEHPAILEPSSNSFAEPAQQHSGSEQSAQMDEPPYSAEEECWLRMQVAFGYSFDYMASESGRTLESILRFLEDTGIFWAREEDDQLRGLGADENAISHEVMENLTRDGRRFEDEVFERAKTLAKWDRAAREVLEAGNSDSRAEHSPAGDECSDEMEDEPGQDVCSGQKPTGKSWLLWKRQEVNILMDWKEQHPKSWKGIENVFPYRSVAACKRKWVDRDREVYRSGYRASNKWTVEEVVRLKEWAAGHEHWPTGEVLREQFPGRTIQQCSDKFWRDGDAWTAEEDDYLLGIQVQPDTDWGKVAENTSLQKGRSGTEAQKRYVLLIQCKAQGRRVRNLGERSQNRLIIKP